jgi:pimeloyl-ACP methyl ester carboxylesterase
MDSFPLAGWRRDDLAVRGIPVARWIGGSGAPIVLVHGVGPGTTGLANFRPVLQALAARYEVHLTDLIGFGRSGRKEERPFFDPALWLEQVKALVAACPTPPLLVGNSMGGALALKAAASGGMHRVVAIGAPAARFAMPAPLRRFWAAPTGAEELAAAMRPMSSGQDVPAPETVAARLAVFADQGYAAYFAAMMDDADQASLDSAALDPAEGAAIGVPLTLVYGRDDRAVPPDLILPSLLPLVPRADLVLFGGCGHNVAWERTDDLTTLIDRAAGGWKAS